MDLETNFIRPLEVGKGEETIRLVWSVRLRRRWGWRWRV